MAEATGSEKREIKTHLWKKMESSPYVMLGLMDGAHSEPMTAQLDEDQVDTIFFFAGKDNRAAGGGAAMVQFVSKGHDFFACIKGNVRRDDDRAMIDKLWNNQVEAWFPGGKSDPSLTLLRLDIESAELWETDMSLSGRMKMLFGGTIDYSESGTHAVVGTTAERTPA